MNISNNFDKKYDRYSHIFFFQNSGRQNYLIPGLDAIVKETFGPEIPSVGDIERRTALALVNTNPAMDYLAPLPENVIPVAGVQIKDPKPLPKVILTTDNNICD